MLPAHEGLGSNNPFAIEHLRLVMQHELIALYGLAQTRLERCPFHYHGLHGRVEETQRVTPQFLRLVHGEVRLLQKLVDRCLVAPEHGCTNAGRTAVIDIIKLVRLAQDIKDDFAHALCLAGRFLGSWRLRAPPRIHRRLLARRYRPRVR